MIQILFCSGWTSLSSLHCSSLRFLKIFMLQELCLVFQRPLSKDRLLTLLLNSSTITHGPDHGKVLFPPILLARLKFLRSTLSPDLYTVLRVCFLSYASFCLTCGLLMAVLASSLIVERILFTASTTWLTYRLSSSSIGSTGF